MMATLAPAKEQNKLLEHKLWKIVTLSKATTNIAWQLMESAPADNPLFDQCEQLSFLVETLNEMILENHHTFSSALARYEWAMEDDGSKSLTCDRKGCDETIVEKKNGEGFPGWGSVQGRLKDGQEVFTCPSCTEDVCKFLDMPKEAIA